MNITAPMHNSLVTLHCFRINAYITSLHHSVYCICILYSLFFNCLMFLEEKYYHVFLESILTIVITEKLILR